MKNVCFVILLLFSAQTYSQKKNQFNFSIGTGIPLSNFQDSDENYLESGYAKVGYTRRVSYARVLKKRFTVQLDLLTFKNSTDNTSKLEEFKSTFPTVKPDSIQQTNPWRNSSLLLGISKTIQFYDGRFSIQPKVHVGCSFNQRPSFFISAITDNQIIPEREIGGRAFSLALMAGLKNNYSIKDELSVFVTVDCFSTNVNFDFVRYPTKDKNSPVAPENINYTQEIRLLMISCGLSCRF